MARRMVEIGGNTVFGGAPEYLCSRPDIAVVINILEHLKLLTQSLSRSQSDVIKFK